MEFVYHSLKHKDSTAIVYLHTLREYEKVGEVLTITITRMWQCNAQVALFLSLLSFNPTHEHLEALNLIKAPFFSLIMLPLSFRSGGPEHTPPICGIPESVGRGLWETN